MGLSIARAPWRVGRCFTPVFEIPGANPLPGGGSWSKPPPWRGFPEQTPSLEGVAEGYHPDKRDCLRACLRAFVAPRVTCPAPALHVRLVTCVCVLRCATARRTPAIHANRTKETRAARPRRLQPAARPLMLCEIVL